MKVKILQDIAKKLSLNLATVMRIYEQAKVQALDKYRETDAKFEYFVLDIVRNRASARAKLMGKTGVLASVAQTDKEKTIARIFLEAGFRHAVVDGQQVLQFAGQKKQLTRIMTDIENQLRSLSYLHNSVVDGVQYIFYPPKAGMPKIMVELETNPETAQINKYNQYFE